MLRPRVFSINTLSVFVSLGPKVVASLNKATGAASALSFVPIQTNQHGRNCFMLPSIKHKSQRNNKIYLLVS